MNEHWRNLTNESEGKPEQKFDAAYGTILRISKCFQRSKQKLYIYFFPSQAKSLKTICASSQSTDLV
jgi:hypothetical protein